MKKMKVLLMMGLFLLVGCANQNSTVSQLSKPKVAATIFPLYDITRNIAGDDVSVTSILKPGASPHTFEFRPSDLLALDGVYDVFSIGNGLDTWVSEAVDTYSEVKVVAVDQGIKFRNLEGDNDPHYWLNVANAKIIAGNVKDRLVKDFPQFANNFQTNYEVYLKTLDDMDGQVKDILKNVQGEPVVMFHDAWGYFAEAYGVEVVGVFDIDPGKEVTPKHLANLQDLMKQYQVKGIFAEPQLSSSVLQSFVEDNNLHYGVLDPVGGVAGRETYVKMMLYNAEQLYEKLK